MTQGGNTNYVPLVLGLLMTIAFRHVISYGNKRGSLFGEIGVRSPSSGWYSKYTANSTALGFTGLNPEELARHVSLNCLCRLLSALTPHGEFLNN